MRIFSKLGLFIASFLLVFSLSTPLVTAEGSTTEHSTSAKSTTESTEKSTETEHTSGRLAEAKLKVCQNREKNINSIMSRIAERGQKQLDLFSSIATKVESFYTSKGKTLSNYDALVANVNTNRSAAQAAVTAVKTSSVTFKCDGSDPDGAAQSFKDKLKTEVNALQAYRTSVKNLIVGVKSVQGTTSSDKKTTGGQQ